jgi:rubrerythrin
MDVAHFIDTAAELEAEISKLYEALAKNSGDRPVASRLLKLADEEIQHVNLLRRGKNYYEEMPDLFTGLTMDPGDVEAGLNDLRAFHARLGKEKASLAGQLKRMLEFEKRFEKVHMGVSVNIKDATLRDLFSNLTKGDQSHILVLKALIDSFGETA